MARYQVVAGDTQRQLPDLTQVLLPNTVALAAEDDTLAGALKKAKAAAVACLAAQIQVLDAEQGGAVVAQIPAGG